MSDLLDVLISVAAFFQIVRNFPALRNLLGVLKAFLFIYLASFIRSILILSSPRTFLLSNLLTASLISSYITAGVSVISVLDSFSY